MVFTEDESAIPVGMSMKKVFVQAVDREFNVDTLDPDDVEETTFGNKSGYEGWFEIEEDEDMHVKFWGKLTASQGKLFLVVAVSLRADEWESYEPVFVRTFDGTTFSD